MAMNGEDFEIFLTVLAIHLYFLFFAVVCDCAKVAVFVVVTVLT